MTALTPLPPCRVAPLAAGITTHMLSSRCALAIGIDITGAVIAKACARQPSLAHLLHELDGFDIPAVRSLLATTAAAAATAAASTATGGAGGSTQAVTPGASGGAPPPGASSAPASAHAGLQEHAAAPAGHLPGGPCPGDAGVVAPTKVFMDISGKAPAALMVALVRAYLKEFPSARLIVKNEELWAEMERREGAGAGAGRAQGGGAGVACGGGGQGAGIAACGGASGEASAGKGGAGEAFSGQAGHGGPDVAGGGTVVGCGCREAAALLDELGDEVEMFRHSFHPMPKKDKRLAMPRGVPKAPAAAAVPGLAYNAQGTQPPS